jgi:hypothetical protein
MDLTWHDHGILYKLEKKIYYKLVSK